MVDSENRPTRFQKMRDKYRIAIFNEQSYEEVWKMRLSRLNVFTILGSSIMFLIVSVIILIAFTGLREYIPGYPDGQQRRLIVQNAYMVDSLIDQIRKRDQFIHVIQAVVSGDETLEYGSENNREEQQDSGVKQVDVHFEKSPVDSVFRQQVESMEKYNLSVVEQGKTKFQLEHTYFFCPLKGLVVNKFGDTEGHYGVDIAGVQDDRVSAAMDGAVVFTGWTVETGYVIQIQHPNNLLSVYKHNSNLLKKMGEHVFAGEAIATVGNSGEYTTGPHLHFELWYNGTPLNAEEFIVFE